MGITDEDSYRYFWNTWNQYLVLADLGASTDEHRWTLANASTVLHFLNAGTSPRKTQEGVSAITRRRYWRLLDRIYEFALSKHWIVANPARAINEWEKPRAENPKGAVLSSHQWERGKRLLQSACQRREPDNATDARNLAILLCLYELGITPLELRSLNLDALQGNPEANTWTHLQIDGSGVNQRRRFHLEPLVAAALSDWVTHRKHMPNAGKTEHLFCSTHGRMMSADNLHLLVREHLLQVAAASESDPAMRLGPQVIRNTRIVRWINEGTPPAQVALRAGLKDEKGLHHLADHFNREVHPGARRTGERR
ncbi:tyrosine-type recombinase/integrase [Diaphorobacter caeni]|uniref:tyrosine-type recombinase/integrase n=1 Tax=Diaphorobacter caeni TaxID=2784387 RepID=UPI00188E69AD|nr:hypothetical protein [Diaphorobacter caeni]MBF5007354.1 hypothetical protein [Diaphorobacter caeni]